MYSIQYSDSRHYLRLDIIHRIKMPMVFVYTNLKDEMVAADFEVRTSRCISEVLNKPKEVGLKKN